MTRENRWLQLAVVLPMLGLLVLVARAEVLLRSGQSFRIAIKGYDPRDLLHGHYLQYSFDFEWRGASTCGGVSGTVPMGLDARCCVCLTSDVDSNTLAEARQVACDQVNSCDGWLEAASLAPPLRYFVPERQAAELEEALRGRGASLSVTCGPGGVPAIGELYLDGRPWREMMDE
ncbi:MAG TPA: GDYXXLXY domain-containing protein [Polyangiaceae bacterium]|nr:GDYXXLXY domain-containing protein [Polyangiaceae bacterium]